MKKLNSTRSLITPPQLPSWEKHRHTCVTFTVQVRGMWYGWAVFSTYAVSHLCEVLKAPGHCHGRWLPICTVNSKHTFHLGRISPYTYAQREGEGGGREGKRERGREREREREGGRDPRFLLLEYSNGPLLNRNIRDKSNFYTVGILLQNIDPMFHWKGIIWTHDSHYGTNKTSPTCATRHNPSLRLLNIHLYWPI